MSLAILGARFGFATNSSSTHSVVVLPDSLVGKVRSRDANDDTSYGWDKFVLTDPEDKIRYLAAQLFGNYWEDQAARTDVIERLCAHSPQLRAFMDEHDYNNRWSDEGERLPRRDHSGSPLTVDHQSQFGFDTARYRPELVDALASFFMSPSVAIYGGNDNGDEPELPQGAIEAEWLDKFRERDGVRLRRDRGFWVAFDPNDGTRIRWSFGENGEMPSILEGEYLKASAPELVDLKITNWCDTGCAFCYQSSTTKGKHAPFAKIEKIVRLLGEMDVFEIAIGGGEPTAHPDFARILFAIRAAGMVPNFTTLSEKWLDDPEIVNAVLRNVGGIGVSCHDAKGLDMVKRIETALDAAAKVAGGKFASSRVNVTAQHVLGAVPLAATADLLRAASERYAHVLLLGYKEVGFGAKQPRFDADAASLLKLALNNIVDMRRISLSVDTELAQRHPGVLKILKAPKALTHGLREGAFSCYVDAVTSRMAASSYVPVRTMEPMQYDREEFLAAFAKY